MKTLPAFLYIGGSTVSPDNHRGRKKSSNRSSADVREFRFINHDLTAAQQEDLAGYFEAGEWSFDSVVPLVEQGFAFKLSQDARGSGYRAHLIDHTEGSPDFNACLSGRGATPIAALYALLYRHFVLAPDGWAALDGGNGSSPFFG